MTSETFPTLFGCATGGGGKVVILGAPYDRSTNPERSGCVAAPSKLRTLSSPEYYRVKNGQVYDLARKRMMFKGADVSDIGNIRFRHNVQNDDQYLDFLARAITLIAQENKKPLMLGGDHLVSLAALRGFSVAGRNVQVIQLDAHHDYDEVNEGERPTHASFMTYVAQESLAKQVLQVGVRGMAWGAPQLPARIKAIGLTELSSSLLPGTDVYLTVDSDAFDPTIVPAVSYPVPEGLPFSALRSVLDSIRAAKLNIVGADWTEYNPNFDSKNNISGSFVLSGLAQLIESMIFEET